MNAVSLVKIHLAVDKVWDPQTGRKQCVAIRMNRTSQPKHVSNAIQLTVIKIKCFNEIHSHNVHKIFHQK